MELVFNKVNDRWISEFKTDSDFNLHIEGVVEGNVSVFQRSTESGEYAYVRGSTPYPSTFSTVYDHDFSAILYPKYIKVSCATEPTLAVVTDDRGPIVKIEHHFEFNDLEYCEDEWMIGAEWLEETQYGDFYSLFNKLVSFLKENGEFYGDDYGDGKSWYISDGDVISEYTNLTFNGYQPTWMSYSEYGDSTPYISIDLNGPFSVHNGTYASLYEDYVYFSTVPE